MFKGAFVAIATPFRDGKVDEKAFRKLVQFQLDNGIDGIVPCGCTGEAATLSMEEQKKLIKITIEMCDGRVPVVAGTGSNCTKEALELTTFAKKAGCDGALVITPYYNKPTPEGQYRHYAELASKANIPIMLYNVPSRTGTCMLPQTIARLSRVKNIVAVKEAAGSVQQVVDIISLCDITVLSGDDAMTLPFMSVGAVGVVSVIANIIPRQIHDMVAAYQSGDTDTAKKIHYWMIELCKNMFVETNPIPVKTVLAMMGMIKEEWRMPLCEATQETRDKLRQVAKKYKLIK
ncbi:MAG: 4-hydroxy-tetrahydrodipicolinate synthase [Candidatus Omnitrophica bacterium]|nr:4-hydroxy-tetrahydrodipicolinate synthase [Candidatus Omnitrophota bacterium]